MKRTADSIEETKNRESGVVTESVQPTTEAPNSADTDLTREVVSAVRDAAKDLAKESGRMRRLANLVSPWPKGVSGNPSGRRKNDLAKEIAQAIFEGNREAIYEAMVRPLLSGNAYAFSQLADRAYGKLKESHEVTHLHEDTPDTDLNERIAQLERDLGLARQIDEAGTPEVVAGGTGKAGSHDKDKPVLP